MYYVYVILYIINHKKNQKWIYWTTDLWRESITWCDMFNYIIKFN